MKNQPFPLEKTQISHEVPFSPLKITIKVLDPAGARPADGAFLQIIAKASKHRAQTPADFPTKQPVTSRGSVSEGKS